MLLPSTTPISSLDDPRVAEYRNLRDAQLRQLAMQAEMMAAAGRAPESKSSPGLFIAEGELVVRQLVASRLAVRSVLVTPQRLETVADALARLPTSTPIYVADKDVMNAIVGFNIHRGILAAGVRPPAPDLDALLAGARTLIILEDLANHDNLGGIFRAAAALAGAARRSGPDLDSDPDPHSNPPPAGAAILLSPGCCDPLYRKAIRVSMGAALHIPFARIHPWPHALQRVRDAGFTLIGLTPAAGSPTIDQLPPTPRPALLLGAEGPGLTASALELCALKARIPIHPDVDSLNVAMAAGIALHRLCHL